MTTEKWSITALITVIVGIIFIAWLGFGCKSVARHESVIPVLTDSIYVPYEVEVEIPRYFADPCYFGNDKNPAIYFETDRADILPEYNQLLGGIREYMEDCKNLEIHVIGYADERGGEDYNYKLALKRAQMVKKWLTDRGIFTLRIAIKSMGENKPVNKDSGCDVWQLNRKVELVW